MQNPDNQIADEQKPAELVSGFMVVHSNQMEQLRALLVSWLQAHPLSPLEQDVILVQSNGMAQWLKHALAADEGLGIAAALKVSLPASFLWQTYRTVLGGDSIQRSSPLDKNNLTWRLMRLLPGLLEQPRFLPLRRFLQQDARLRKRYQLCERIADIFDQYQVYRVDWLNDWAQGRDRVEQKGELLELVPGQPVEDNEVQLQTLAWQSALWRALQEDIGEQALNSSRAAVHPRFMAALEQAAKRPEGLPRRIVVFGISSLPAQTLEALAAMARFSQVILCVNNPCQYYWGDIVSDRDLARRHQRKKGMPAVLSEEELHQHAHPLLAAWGKQGRDYIALLNEHDNPDAYTGYFRAKQLQVDMFHEESTASLLAQLQSDILHLRPLLESSSLWPPVDPQQDESVCFHVAHSPQREVEILHDQLLDRFSRFPGLQPRDVIVMVPEIDHYAPHIQAVFGQYRPDEPGYLPFAVSDQGQRGQEPLLIALELLLQLPELRMTRANLMTLLDVPALRERFGIGENDVPLLQRWMEGAGVRWGLTASQRSGFGLSAELQQNTWAFGLRRMLAGYAMGEGATLGDIEPYAEVAGLEATALGPLYQLFGKLCKLEQKLRQPASPEDWVGIMKKALENFFQAKTQREILLLARLEQALKDWSKACATAQFTEELPLDIVREAWLEAVDTTRDSQRFLDGAINFCTLMPMRTIPFKAVCLLGMNDGAYPRVQPPLDFDLMAGSFRAGDRSRREDDRYLLLEALLAARQMLYVSWVGRDVRDNSECPPSVLVAQLRDHLALGWQSTTGQPLDEALTCEHPLQPFSRSYFDGVNPALFTYATEWLALHQPFQTQDSGGALPPLALDEPLTQERLLRFIRRPVQQFFAQRFKVYLEAPELGLVDDEPFAMNALEIHVTKSRLLAAATAAEHADNPWLSMHNEAEMMLRSGELPLAGFGTQLLETLLEPLQGQLEVWLARQAQLQAQEHAPVSLQVAIEGIQLHAWFSGLRQPHGTLETEQAQSRLVRPWLMTGEVMRKGERRWSRLLAPWYEHVLLHAAGERLNTEIYAESGCMTLLPLEQEQARAQVHDWVLAWRDGMCEPLPLAFESALAWLQAKADKAEKAARAKPGQTRPAEDDEQDEKLLQAARSAYEGGYMQTGERDREQVLQRQFASFDALAADGRFYVLAQRLYGLLQSQPYEYTPYAMEDGQ